MSKKKTVPPKYPRELTAKQRSEIIGGIECEGFAYYFLELARAMILLSTTQAFTRSLLAAGWLHANPPALEVRIAQTVSFRGGSKSDGISYSVTSWVPHMRHPLPGTPWPCSVLVLPGESRRWRVPPGQEGAP